MPGVHNSLPAGRARPAIVLCPVLGKIRTSQKTGPRSAILFYKLFQLTQLSKCGPRTIWVCSTWPPTQRGCAPPGPRCVGLELSCLFLMSWHVLLSQIFLSSNESSLWKDIWTNVSADEVYVHRLSKDVVYSIQIAAYNEKGEGVRSSPLLVGRRTTRCIYSTALNWLELHLR